MKVFLGKVTSTNMAKTATVAVERFLTHPVYKKRFKRIKKYLVHDEIGVKGGDQVRFTASKPYSKLKKWKILKVVGARSQKKEAKENKK